MRIVGGRLKSRVLLPFDGEKIRPTSDKVRESFFNIIQTRVVGCSFLDLFCGTGAMGIEALSRGANKVVLNDSSNQSITLAKRNAEKLGVKEEIEFSLSDSIEYLRRTKHLFDVIFIDPPYKCGIYEDIVPLCCSVLKENGIVVTESEQPLLENELGDLVKVDQRKYGRDYLTFYKIGEK